MSAAADYTPKREDFEDRVTLVTGATRGIGKTVATQLVSLGARVILHGRQAQLLDALRDELKSLGPEPSIVQLDLETTQGDAYVQLADAVESRHGRLDALLHNAAILGDRTKIEDYDIALWHRVLQVNLTAPFMLTRCLFPLLQASNDASIVFTTSSVATRGKFYGGAYSVSKTGIEGLMQILFEENASTNVRCNVINPGRTRTDMRRSAYPEEDPTTLPTPEDIVGPYLYLLGRASSGVTGQRVAGQSRLVW